MNPGELMYQKYVFLFVFMIFFQCSYAFNKIEYNVGIAFSKTNKYDRSTQQIIDGINLAKIMFEQKYPKYKVNFINYIYLPNNLGSVSKISDKICRDKIPVVIGGEMTEDALMLGEKLNSCHIVLISPTATNPKVTENKKYVFRMSVSDQEVAEKLSVFVKTYFNSPAIGVVHDISLPYPDFLTKSFLKAYSHNCKNLIINKKVLREKIDYSLEIDDFLKKNINIIIMLTYDIDFKKFLSQAAEKNYFPIYIGSDGWGSNESIIRIIHNNSYIRNHFVGYRNDYWSDNNINTLNICFKKLYKKTYTNHPDSWSAIGFDSAWLIFNAFLKKQNKLNAEELKNQIANIHNLNLLTTNNFKFKRDHSPKKALYIYKITIKGAEYLTMLKDRDDK